MTDPSISLLRKFCEGPALLQQRPDPADVNQGYVGDCYFLSTLASVAKLDPSLIRKDGRRCNGDGTFHCELREWQNNYTSSSQRRPAGLVRWAIRPMRAWDPSNSLWVAVMEKQAFGGLHRTHADTYAFQSPSGWMTEVFSIWDCRASRSSRPPPRRPLGI